MDVKDLDTLNHRNYSKEDGKALIPLEGECYTVKKIKEEYCDNCGFENEDTNIYCKNCGVELYSICEDKYLKKNKYDVRKMLFTIFSSIIILFVCSIAYKGIIFMDGGNLSEIINPIHILLAMNLGELDLFTTSIASSTVVNIQIGMIVMIMLPVIVLIISNIIFMKHKNDDIKTIIKNSVSIGALYGIVLAILSLFSKVRISNNSMFMYSSALIYGFTMFSLLINGFILGFISTFIVGIFKANKENMVVNIIQIAIKTISAGVVFVFIILLLLSMFNNTYIHELGLYNYVNKMSLGVVLLQLAVYSWAFSNLIPVTIGNIYFSILGMSSLSLSFDTKLIFFAMIFISMLLMVVVGNKLKIKYHEYNNKPVRIFSMFYSLIMGVLALISTIVVSGSSVSSVAMGFSFIMSVIISYIYSFIVTLIGYKLS